MTREEFEAVLAIEGKYIKMMLTREKARRRKGYELWNAVVWKWEDVETIDSMHRRLFTNEKHIETEREIQSIAVVRGAHTPYKAIQHLMYAWEKGNL